MKKTILLLCVSLFFCVTLVAKPTSNPREFWAEQAYKMSHPVLDALSRDCLKEEMFIEQFEGAGRENYACLEAVGRLLCGISPWLELPVDQTNEGKMRSELLALAHKGLANGVDPEAADYLNFSGYGQPLVDAAFLAQAFLRSPKQLWGGLDAKTKERIINEMKSTRNTRPSFNNWLLFSAIVEAFLREVDGTCDLMRTDYAFRQIEEWYVGDGQYADGPKYHNDYYNSFVIQPMLVDAVIVMNKYHKKDGVYSDERVSIIKERAARYAEVLERSISPEGTFPVVGRSILYRTGCLQSLSHSVLLKTLPNDISEGQVREALTLVIRRMLEANETYKDGWLTMGFCGAQKESGEYYLCTGSMYLASTVFLPLGLPSDDSFWSCKGEEWTSKKAWSGKPFKRDGAIGR